MKTKYFCKSFLAVVAISLVASGCAQMPGSGGQGPAATQTAAASQTSAADSCVQERSVLNASQEHFAADMVKAMMAGVATGLATSILSGDTKNLGQTVVASAASAMGGYWAALQKNNLSGGALFSKLSGDLAGENAKTAEAISKRDNLYACRDREIAAVRAEYASKKIDLATGNARTKRIYEAQLQDAEILKSIGTKAKERNGNFVYATSQATGASPEKVQAAKPAAGGKPAAADTAAGTQVAMSTNNQNVANLQTTKPLSGPAKMEG